MATIERCAATDTQAIATLAWAQAHAPATGTLALAPMTIPVVVCPENRWQSWITHQLPQALLLPSVILAIAGQGNSTTTELEQSLATSAQPKQIALLPPAKASNRSRKSSTAINRPNQQVDNCTNIFQAGCPISAPYYLLHCF
jgi:hypothetical protein